MIFVSLGTQDKPFNRIIDYVISLKENLKEIKSEKIIIQLGQTKLLKSDNEIKLLELDILKSKQYTIHSMSWSIVISGRNYRISISKLGLINISEYLVLDFIDYIESKIL